jgi:hypothetical protein
MEDPISGRKHLPDSILYTRGWFKGYSKPEVKYEHKRKERQCVFGAVSESNTIYSFTERFNSDTFQDFLLKLIDMFKKIVILIDHAPYHVSHKMQEFYTGHEDTVHVEYFPSYSLSQVIAPS